MKRIFILGIVGLLAVGSLLAKEDVLIDFTQLTADGEADDENGIPAQNEATTINTASHAANNYTEEQKKVMVTSLAITNWKVWLSSSSASVENQSLSYTKEAESAANGTVMGVRAHFPVANWNATATVRPPFEIPAYEPASEDATATDPSKFEGGYGVVKNVGTLKSVAVNVYGELFPYTLYVLLLDDKGKETAINMGTLKFSGWGELRWDNPRYVQDVRDRELRLDPLYPFSTPFVKFNGFRIVKDGSQRGGDFISYFKDVKIIYDEAVLETESDIADEAIWNIVSNREANNSKNNSKDLSDRLYFQSLDQKKQAKESFGQPAESDE